MDIGIAYIEMIDSGVQQGCGGSKWNLEMINWYSLSKFNKNQAITQEEFDNCQKIRSELYFLWT
jgi:hypothetical protein